MRFDDGTRDVPGGLSGRPERVVIIGAGMAGLAAANALATAGVECVVLEARDRVGGRLHTVELGGGTVDLGGAWIHHPVGNPMTLIAEQLGVPRVSADFRPDAVFVDPGDGTVVEVDDAEMTEVEAGFYEALDRYIAEMGPDASLEDAARRFFEEIGASDWQRVFIRIFSEAEAAAPMSLVSLPGFPPGDYEYGGSGIGDFPVGGYRRIVNGLLHGFEVRTSTPVESVRWDAGGVEVRLADGTTEQGSHVVVTVPLGVLKAGSIRFDSGLPDDKIAAIARIGFGRFEKVALGFDRPAGAAKPHLYPMAETDLRAMLNLERITGNEAVVATAFGSSADLIAGRDPDEAAEHALGHLRRAWGDVPDPVEVRVTSWSSDPYSLGAYSYLAVGSTREDIDRLAAPVDGRVLFAGEATSSPRMGYADGAFSTGIREAKRLLGVPEVEITVG